jgi:GNAT superfamily N-acetyltransferase
MNIEYFEWVAQEILNHHGIDVFPEMGSVHSYVEQSLKQYVSLSPPKGVSYLVLFDKQVAGMGFLRRLQDDIGEIKRFYIRPKFRGQGLGKKLLKKLIQKAKSLGFRTLYIETGHYMKIAHHLYKEAGFIERGPYTEIEAPRHLQHISFFMEKHL